MTLIDYTGSMSGQVWKFLDEVQITPSDPYSEMGYDKERKQLTDPSDRAKLERECSLELFAGIKKIMLNSDIPKGGATKSISELHERLRVKYPMFAGSLKL